MLYALRMGLVLILMFIRDIYVNAKEKNIVAITCMYNNEKWVDRNLSSIFAQDYTNFRLIIVDDGSTDQTTECILKTVTKYNATHKTTFIKNKTRKRKLANLYRILYTVDDEDIVIIIDGDDWLAHSYVFSYINTLYDEDIFFTYGQYQNIPASEAIAWGFNPMGYAKAVPDFVVNNHAYRKGPFYYMHLRTFKGWIFKLIKLEDLLCNTVEGFKGDFFPASNDLAMYYPIVEMAHTKTRFVPDILYIRNLYSNLVGFKVDRQIQIDSAREVKRRKSYPCIEKAVYRDLEKAQEKDVDVIVASKTIKKYRLYKKSLPKSTFLKYKDVPAKQNTLNNDYILVSFDENRFPLTKTIKYMIYQMERTYAKGILNVDKKHYKKICSSLPLAWLEEKKLYACKNAYINQPTNMISSLLIKKTDFTSINVQNVSIENFIETFLKTFNNDISLLHLS